VAALLGNDLGYPRPDATARTSAVSPLTWPDPLPAAGAIRLRPYRESDLRLVAELATDPYLPLIGSIPAEYSDEAGRAFLARQHQRLEDEAGFSFAVARRTDDLAVGGAGLWLGGAVPGTASAGYAIAPPYRNAGYATAALVALTRFAWTRPELERIDLFVEPDIVASVAVAEHAGYVRLGLRPGHHEIGGRRRDMLHYRSARP